MFWLTFLPQESEIAISEFKTPRTRARVGFSRTLLVLLLGGSVHLRRSHGQSCPDQSQPLAHRESPIRFLGGHLRQHRCRGGSERHHPGAQWWLRVHFRRGDEANLYDSTGDDKSYGSGNIARLYDAAMAAYLAEVRSFQKVDVFGSTGTNARTIVRPIDYALTFSGTWVGDPWP